MSLTLTVASPLELVLAVYFLDLTLNTNLAFLIALPEASFSFKFFRLAGLFIRFIRNFKKSFNFGNTDSFSYT